MRERIIILGIVMCLSMLSFQSCVDVPEDIKSRYEGNHSVNADADKLKENYKTSTFAEMRAAIPEKISELKSLKLDNMTFSEHLTIDIPEKVKTGNYICPTGFEKKYLELFRHYKNDLDEEKLSFDERLYPRGHFYSDSDNKLDMSIGCTGFFSYYKDFDDAKFYNESQCIKSYTAEEARNSNDAYKVIGSDGNISVSEAIEKAQAFADDFVSASDYPSEMNAIRISLSECEDGYFYKIDFAQRISGARVLEYHSQFREIEDTEPGTILQPQAFICSDEINAFVVNAYFDEYETNEEIGSAVDVVDAAKYISEELSGYLKLEVKRIAFEYYMIRGENIEEKVEGILTDREFAPWATYCSYDLFKAVPCYVFYFDETPDKEIFAILRCDDMSVDFVNNAK